MATYQIFSDSDDTVLGTSGADVLSGDAGGTDTIDLGGGDDVVTIYQGAIWETYYYDGPEPGGGYADVELVGLEPPFSGTLVGGDGIDTLEVDIGSTRYGGDVEGRDFGPFSFRDMTLSGFEHLRFHAHLEISLEQLHSFQTVEQISDTTNTFGLSLFGEGGVLNLEEDLTLLERNTVFSGLSLTSGFTVIGSAGREEIWDSAFGDSISGGDGNDTIRHTGGADTIEGGHGIDTFEFRWETGAPLFLQDILDGAAMPDGTVATGFEQLRVMTGTEDALIYGSEAADEIRSFDGNDVIYGKGGADFIEASRGDDTIYGGDGDDRLGGGLGMDRLYGGAGDDFLMGGRDDWLSGGTGNDTIYVYANDSAFGGDGDDSIRVMEEAIAFGDNAIEGGDGNDKIVVRSFHTAYGGGHNDTITAYSSADDVRMFGGWGHDALTGGIGDDLLDGGRGRDTMTGGAGDDTYVITEHGDVVIEGADEGNDSIVVRYSYILPQHVENLEVTGIYGDGILKGNNANGWGNAADNVIIGNIGNNRLNGLAGADTLIGGQGNDTYIVNVAGDTVIELAGEGTDTIQTQASFTLPDHVERLTLFGTKNSSATGNDAANVLNGNAGNNILTGKGGLDALTGGDGADSFVYLALSDSNAVNGIDRIVDFDAAEGDIVDVSAIDANEGLSGDQAFDTVIPSNEGFLFAGEVRFSLLGGGYYLAEFNTDTDLDAELAIRFQSDVAPEAGWFVM